ncbi:SDR family NAD(P)-dependent oxidoreductase [Micromonospora sp. WMMD882]|uniref:SDR family NAD(P)-dependent oxidoreductase n=1 Tax=Micromonospora sp. WMMD882 TaxID=3015151 RepID=UPI00248B9325|nr:SDR family NAD(P)-dependent oxidoreductase [Micromonospora sp. WMMD882]WBB81583.1 SDR family NAD(P)-dependent oxidoreductase [Micromonospora sp. WMMD882]
MSTSLVDRCVLITGGTGSFGQTMVTRLLDAGAGEVRVLSRDEAKQEAMRIRLRDDRVRFYVGDVRDRDAVSKATRGVEYVFHAAALKQVPSCEFFPLEAVRTNVLGSANVVDACERHDVSALVFLSTDKAVYPINAMGMTKGLMEKVAQAHVRNNPRARTRVCSVRYGNVMCSRGSVIPLFIEQIRNGVPLTVTEPAMTRFLMSLADSVELVEHAFEHGQPGDIFIRKAPASTIGDLATALCNLFEVPAKFDVIGLRHGEKMFETLASHEELARAEDFGSFLRVRVDSRDLNYSLYFEEGDPSREHRADYTSENTTRLTVPEIMSLLLTLPEVRQRLEPVAASAGCG